MQTHDPNSENREGVAAREPLLEVFKGIWRELPGLISDRVELLSVELQRAGLALAHIVVLCMALSVLGVTMWVMLWCLIVAGLVLLGVHWMVALLVALGIQLVLVVWAVHRLKSLLPLLRLPATRRRLMFTSAPGTEQTAPPDSKVAQPNSPAHDTAAST